MIEDKGWNDILATLDAELNKWFVAQCHNVYAHFYLWYRQTTEAAPGAIKISEEKPGVDYELATGQMISRGCTVEQNRNGLVDIVFRLPILPL